MAKLTTRVLDIANGVPAKDMSLRLIKQEGESRTTILATRTNSDGRCDSPLLEGGSMQAGTYELEFEAGEYFGSSGINDPASHYHVPLLVSPFSYSTYRGS